MDNHLKWSLMCNVTNTKMKTRGPGDHLLDTARGLHLIEDKELMYYGG